MVLGNLVHRDFETDHRLLRRRGQHPQAGRVRGQAEDHRRHRHRPDPDRDQRPGRAEPAPPHQLHHQGRRPVEGLQGPGPRVPPPGDALDRPRRRPDPVGQVYQFLRTVPASSNSSPRAHAEQYLRPDPPGHERQQGVRPEPEPDPRHRLREPAPAGPELLPGVRGRRRRHRPARGVLGRKFGFDIFMAQNQPVRQRPRLADQVDRRRQQRAGYALGTKTFTVDGLSAAITANGSWITIAGDDTPLQVVLDGRRLRPRPRSPPPGPERRSSTTRS